jgi:glycosyltransferase involved in cell wall biosynthesis
MQSVQNPAILVFQTAYTYQEMVDRDITIFFTSKDLGGYFKRVITVHPISDYSKMLESKPEYGKTNFIKHNEIHTFIEGRIARFSFLGHFKTINFLIAQLDLFFAIRNHVKELKIDFIRAEDPRLNGLWGVLFRRVIGVPLFVGNWGNPQTIRNLTQKPLMPRFFKKIWVETFVEEKIFNIADCVMAQNADNLQFVLDYGIDPKKTAIFRLGNAVNPCHFKDPSERTPVMIPLMTGLEPNTKVLLCAFALEKRKILEDVFEVVNLLKSEFNIKLVVAGDGSARDDYAKLCNDMNLKNQVIFLGNIPQEALSFLMVKANVILSPLTGRALAESVLSSTPVVAYNIDCHPELIESGITGELVPFRDWKQMAEKTRNLLLNEQYAEEIGFNGRQTALEFMDPGTIIKTQVKVFQEYARLL